MRSPFGKFRNEGGGREFFLSLHREQEEGHRGCSHLVACCRASAAAVQRGSAFPVSPSVAEAARRKRQRGSACSGPPPHPFPPGDLRNRAPSRHLLAGGPAMARHCHLCSGLGRFVPSTAPAATGPRVWGAALITAAASSPRSPVLSLPAMLPTKVKRHRGVWGREQLSGVSPADARLNVAPKARGPSYPANRCPGVFSLLVTQDLSLQETVN